MRESLVRRGRMISPIIVVLSLLAWEDAPALNAQAHNVLGIASLQGDYAVVNHYGSSLALGIGTVQFDGKA